MKYCCDCNPNVVIKPDGVNELDPCVYVVDEVYVNVTVEISHCEKCGKINISWFKQDNTERVE